MIWLLALGALLAASPSTLARKFTVQSTPSLANAKEGRLVEVSCPPKSEQCMAVGWYKDKTGTIKTLAERMVGTWSAEEPENTGTSPELLGVSCATTELCEAVGRYTDGEGFFRTIAEIWKATATPEWKLQKIPEPAGTYTSEPESVSCPSTSECIAVGEWQEKPGGKFPLVEHLKLSGTPTWTDESPPPPTGATFPAFTGVSCAENERCNAVGAYRDPTEQIGLAEEWRGGTSWTNTTAFKPTGEKTLLFQGDSCPKAKECIGVGHYIDSFGFTVGLAEKLSSGATTWGSMTTVNPWEENELFHVSCPASYEACVAVGQGTGGLGFIENLAEELKGNTWETVQTSLPTGALAGGFSGVSCSTIGDCEVVGSYVNKNSEREPLAEGH